MKKILLLTLFTWSFISFAQQNQPFSEILRSFDSITDYKKRDLKITNAINTLILKESKVFKADTLILSYGLFIDPVGKIHVSSNNTNDDNAYYAFEDLFKSTIKVKPFRDSISEKTTNHSINGYGKYLKNNVNIYEKIITKKATVEDDTFIKFSIIENVPQYPGCTGDNRSLKNCMSSKIGRIVAQNFNIDLANNLNLRLGKHRIFVSFIVDKKGFVTNIKARAPHPFLAREAVRIIKKIPKMDKPGMQRGKTVKVKYMLPITFIVEQDEVPVKPKKRRWFQK